MTRYHLFIVGALFVVAACVPDRIFWPLLTAVLTALAIATIIVGHLP